MLGEIKICCGTFCVVQYGKAILGLCLLCAYLLDIPNFTYLPFRPKLELFMASASRMPLLRWFGILVKEWIPLIDEYYYCTSICILVSIC